MGVKIHCLAKKKSRHPDLTMHIGKSLILDKYCMYNYFYVFVYEEEMWSKKKSQMIMIGDPVNVY